MAAYDITTANSLLQFDTTSGNQVDTIQQLDANHFLSLTLIVAQVLAVNTTTWAVTTAGSPLTIGNTNTTASSFKVDTNHFIIFQGDPGAPRGYAQILIVNTTTFAVTTATRFTFNGNYGATFNSCYKIDTNHFINFWRDGSGPGGLSQVFTVNTTTWAVTTAGAAKGLIGVTFHSCFKIDANHFIEFCATSANGYVGIYTVNTTTWAITTASTELNFSTDFGVTNFCYQIDTNHFINLWWENSKHGVCQIFAVNTSTFAVTTAGAKFQMGGNNSSISPTFSKVDANHFILFWSDQNTGGAIAGRTEVLTINTSTWAITTSAGILDYDTRQCYGNACYQVDTNHFIDLWAGTNSIAPQAQVFTVQLPAVGPANLKTYNGLAIASIKTINGLAIASVKTWNGLN